MADREMTNEEAIEILEYRRCLICHTCHYFHTPVVCERCNERNCKGEKEALKMAIDALKAKPKHGRWKDAGMGDYRCSRCDEIVTGNRYFYCPNCGAEMRALK